MIEPEILKLIIPLIGVLIGWFLNSVTGFRKERSETNQKLGRAISNLIEVNIEIKSLLNSFELFKNTSESIVNYEQSRQTVNRRYSVRKDSFEEVLKSIEDISGLYPIEGMKLKSIITNYIFSKKMSLKETAKLGKDAYIHLLSIYEVALEIEQKQLEKLIIKLAYKHSFSQWWKVRKYLTKGNKNSNQFADSKLQKGLEDIARRANTETKKSAEENLDLEKNPKKEKLKNTENK